MFGQLDASLTSFSGQATRWQSSDGLYLNKRSEERWLLLYINQGTISLQSEQMMGDLKAGDWLIHELMPSEDFKIAANPTGEPYTVYLLDLPAEQIQQEASEAPHTAQLNFRWPVGPQPTRGNCFNLILPKRHQVQSPVTRYQIVQYFNAAVRQWARNDEYSRTLGLLSVLEILVRLAADFQWAGTNEHPALVAGSVSDARVQQVIEILHQEFAKKITGADLARQIGVNFDYLNRQFRRRMGQTIFVYLTHLRIQQACCLLGEKDRGLHEIATASGFSDEYRFSKVFKQIVGTTPRRYQQTLTDQIDPMV